MHKRGKHVLVDARVKGPINALWVRSKAISGQAELSPPEARQRRLVVSQSAIVSTHVPDPFSLQKAMVHPLTEALFWLIGRYDSLTIDQAHALVQQYHLEDYKVHIQIGNITAPPGIYTQAPDEAPEALRSAE